MPPGVEFDRSGPRSVAQWPEWTRPEGSSEKSDCSTSSATLHSRMESTEDHGGIGPMDKGQHNTVFRHVQTLFRVGTAGALTDGQLLERFTTQNREAAELAFAA